MKKGGYMSQSEEVTQATDKQIEKLTEELAQARAEAAKLAEELKASQAMSVAVRTSPAKEQRSPAGVLERAAKRAAGTGSRSDLQEYMRRRRSIV
jgi:transcriptional/translational regulatory protein YebC/TACO1